MTSWTSHPTSAAQKPVTSRPALTQDRKRRAIALIRRQRRRIDDVAAVGRDELHAPGAGALALARGTRLMDE